MGRGQGWGLAGVDPLAATAYSPVHKGDPRACVARPPWPKGSESPARVAPPRPPASRPGSICQRPATGAPSPHSPPWGPRLSPFPPFCGTYGMPRRQGQLCAGAVAGAPPHRPCPQGRRPPSTPAGAGGSRRLGPRRLFLESWPGLTHRAQQPASALQRRSRAQRCPPPKYVHVLAPVPLENVPLSRKRVLADAAMVKTLRWDHSD